VRQSDLVSCLRIFPLVEPSRGWGRPSRAAHVWNPAFGCFSSRTKAIIARDFSLPRSTLEIFIFLRAKERARSSVRSVLQSAPPETWFCSRFPAPISLQFPGIPLKRRGDFPAREHCTSVFILLLFWSAARSFATQLASIFWF
jgi:hypothetical protein